MKISIIETSIYFFQAIDPTLFGRKLTPKQTRNLICFVYFLLGLPMCFRCGYDILRILNNFSFLIPLCFINMINCIIFGKDHQLCVPLPNEFKPGTRTSKYC